MLQDTSMVRRQRGLTLFGMIFWAVVVAFLGAVAIKVLPTLNEYFTIQKAIRKVMDEAPGSEAGIRAAFERQKQIEYAITTIGGRDLEINNNGDKYTVRFAYDKEIELFDPIYLLIKYQGSASSH